MPKDIKQQGYIELTQQIADKLCGYYIRVYQKTQQFVFLQNN
jgi:hypothetical protein